MKLSSSQLVKPIRFGTDGWRAVIGDEFTFANLERVTQAYADYLKKTHSKTCGDGFNQSDKLTSEPLLTIIGYDGRFLSKQFARRATEILAGNNLDFMLFDGPVPTPLISWAVREKKAAGGLMITASHNPAEYNGFKMKAPWGGSAPNYMTAEVESFIDYSSPKGAEISNSPNLDFIKSVTGSYRSQILNYLDLDKIRSIKNCVVIDSMHGTGGRWIERFLMGGKIEPETIRAECDPLFGGGQPEPIDSNLNALKQKIADRRAVLGLATDGDADRFGVVNERGQTVTMHEIAPLLLLHLIRRRGMTGGVVRSFSQSVLIRRIAAAYHLPLYETPIGFKYVTEMMRKENILLGAEESGGISVQGHIPERDGILNSLLLLEAIAMTGETISEMVSAMHREFGEFHFRSWNMKMNVGDGQGFIAGLASLPPVKIADEKVCGVETVDGTKLIFADESWLLFRQSGTEPKLRIYSEATSLNKTQALIEAGKLLATGNRS